MMIKLSDDCYVAADEIAEMRVNGGGGYILVKMKSGVAHCHEPGYRQGIYEALDELVAKVNAAEEAL